MMMNEYEEMELRNLANAIKEIVEDMKQGKNNELERLKEKERELWTGGMNKETKIFYLCDHRACLLCNGEICDHTKNIEHARNFKNKHGIYVENDNRDKEDELEKALKELIKLGNFYKKDYEIIESKVRHILNMFRG